MKSSSRKIICLIAVLIASSSLAAIYWPYKIIAAGYVFVQTDRAYDFIKDGMVDFTWYQDKGGSAALFESDFGGRHLFHDGYHSLDFYPDGKGLTNERLIGTSVASLIAEDKTNKLLVMGFGSGVSTGAASRVFKEVEVYETRESLLEMAEDEFSDENYDVINADNVNINIQDAIIGAANSKDGEYDAILINVPSPGLRGAEKMYSVELYSLAQEKLKNHGLVFTWISAGLGYEVLQVILNNFEAAYGDRCRYFLMNDSYYQIICAPNLDPDAYRAITPRTLGVENEQGDDFGYLTRISEAEKVGEPAVEMKGKLHTLDHPWFDTRALFESVFKQGYSFDRIFSLIHEEEYREHQNRQDEAIQQ